MEYTGEIKQHIKQLEEIDSRFFDISKLQKEIAQQNRKMGASVKSLLANFDENLESIYPLLQPIFEHLVAKRMVMTTELILNTYAVMGSKIVIDAGLTTDLRKGLSIMLRKHCRPCLELMRETLGRNRNELRHSELSSYVEIFKGKIEECINDIDRFTHDMERDVWVAADATHQAERNFIDVTNFIASTVQRFGEGLKAPLRTAIDNAHIHMRA
jgi:hypothetical protein